VGYLTEYTDLVEGMVQIAVDSHTPVLCIDHIEGMLVELVSTVADMPYFGYTCYLPSRVDIANCFYAYSYSYRL
jgi:predicted HAD superfamily Cof-like phosphohydrolase